jgi:hypothetical protein
MTCRLVGLTRVIIGAFARTRKGSIRKTKCSMTMFVVEEEPTCNENNIFETP